MPDWATVVTTAITGASTLSAVGLTHRYTAQRWREERADDRRIEQRDAAAGLLDAGRVWASSAAGINLGIAGLNGDMTTLASDTGILDRYAEPFREMRRAVTTARLTITEPSVAEQVYKVSRLVDGSGEYFMQVIRATEANPGGVSAEAAALSHDFYQLAARELDELERVALAAFSSIPKRRRQRWRLRSSRTSPPPFAPDLAEAPPHPEEPKRQTETT